MKHLLVAILIAAPAWAAAQNLLEFRDDLAFDARTVDTMAEAAYRTRLHRLAAAGQLDANPLLLDRLRDLVAILQRAAQIERPGTAIAWEIHTCRRCGENASAMAGGKLLVGEEFIAELAATDDELGYLLAHEMAHVLAEHAREYATTARFFMGNGKNREYWDIQNELDENIIVGLNLASLSAYQELEADYFGFVLGARSGFEPAAMLQLLHKLHRGPVTSLSMHAQHGERLARAQAMLETARRIQEMSFVRQ